MAELIIKYKSKRVLEVLIDLAKQIGFSVIIPKENKPTIKNKQIHGVTILASDPRSKMLDPEPIFSGKNLNARELRQKLWQRNS